MEEESVWKTYLLFYADTPAGEKNKLFKWEIPSIIQWRERLTYWIKKGMLIRSAYVEEKHIDTSGNVLEKTNQRIEDAEIQAIVDAILIKR